MRERNVQQFVNDSQYTKDGMMNKRTFISFVKDLIREYGEKRNHSIYITLDDLPDRMQQEYLKQYFFFENWIKDHEEIFHNPTLVRLAIQEEKEALNYWMDECVRELEEETFLDHVAQNDLRIMHRCDNDEIYLVRA